MPENRTASLEERLVSLEGSILALHYVMLNIVAAGSTDQIRQTTQRLGNLRPDCGQSPSPIQPMLLLGRWWERLLRV